MALGDSAGGTTPYVVTWLTAETGNNAAPAYYVVAAAIVSLLTILTIRETAGRSLPQGAADEMFQSNADVAATPPLRRRCTRSVVAAVPTRHY